MSRRDTSLIRATEHQVYGYMDYRATFGTTTTPYWWNVIWMAVSCCCGIEGKAETVNLPAPEPRIHRTKPEPV